MREFAELFAAGRPGPSGPGLTDDQVETRLLEFFAVVHTAEPEKMRPGDVIRHRIPSFGTGTSDTEPMVFLRYLPEKISGLDLPIDDPSKLSSLMIALEYDALALILIRGTTSQSIIPRLIDSRNYKVTRPAD